MLTPFLTPQISTRFQRGTKVSNRLTNQRLETPYVIFSFIHEYTTMKLFSFVFARCINDYDPFFLHF